MKKASVLLVSMALLCFGLAFFVQPAPAAPAPEKTETTANRPDSQAPAVFQTPAHNVVERVAPNEVRIERAQIFGGGLTDLFALLAKYWAKISTVIIAAATFIEVIVRVTPTEKDNAWFSWLKTIIDKLIPNNKLGGGTHP